MFPSERLSEKKKLRFLHYILNEDPKSIVHRVFKSQMEHTTKRDWVTTVQQDLQVLGISNLSMDKTNEEDSVAELGKTENKHENI